VREKEKKNKRERRRRRKKKEKKKIWRGRSLGSKRLYRQPHIRVRLLINQSINPTIDKALNNSESSNGKERVDKLDKYWVVHDATSR